MVCTANDLLGWKDFPKGLKVLLLDEDSNSAAEIRSKLEQMEYTVFTFLNENEALSAIANKSETFHVAIVEVTTDNSDGRFKFLESAKDLPTIMISNMHCLSTMMKCIALGAVEFLRKPLSEDKLRNIWQHVVHKAFNAGEKDLSESLKPVKESVVSMLKLELGNEESKIPVLDKTEDVTSDQENGQELSAGCDKYPAPSTPQLEQGMRLVDDVDCVDQTNLSTDKESMEQDGECRSVETSCGNYGAECTVQASQSLRFGEQDGDSKSVETTCVDSGAEHTVQNPNHRFVDIVKEVDDGSKGECNTSPQPENEDHANDFGGEGTESLRWDDSSGEHVVQTNSNHRFEDTLIKEEDDGSKGESNMSPATVNGDHPNDFSTKSTTPDKGSGHPHYSRGAKSNRKKMKVDWTPELHNKFVHAVEQLGVDLAIPSRILELMKVEGLTRHNVASHLQKYRIQRRHILQKEDSRRWPHPRDSTLKNNTSHKPIMAFPPYHSSHVFPPPGQVYPAWGHIGSSPAAGIRMWGLPYYPVWQGAESWPWKPCSGVQADAWGCPVMPPSLGSCPSPPQNAFMFQNASTMQNSIPQKPLDHFPAEEVIDKAVKEAISKPWLPLPLGLKPPSTECVLTELSKQGISTVPPHHINGTYNL